MICIKTEMKEMPKNCSECWVLCGLPCENNNYENIVKEEYCNNRHEDCPLMEVIKGFYEGVTI